MATLDEKLRGLDACNEGREWASGYRSAAKAWRECRRGDWMLWLVGKLSGPPESEGRKKLILCACECARLSLTHTKDPGVLVCIETAERWARGEATIEELTAARNATYTDAADAATYAAAAAAAAADADAAAADAYACAACAACAAYAAAAAACAAYAAARRETLAKCADIVRRHYPAPPKVSPN